MAYAKGVDINKIRSLYVKATNQQLAKSTRKRAREELYAISEKQRSVANSRLATLRREDLAYGNAYDNARHYILQHSGTKAKSFHKIKQDESNIGAIYEQALAINKFVSSEESRASHQRAIEEKRFETFRTREDFAEAFADLSDADLKSFLRYMGNQWIGDYLSKYEDSGDELERIVEIWQDESTNEEVTDLLNQFKQYRKAELDAERNNEIFDAENAAGLSYSELEKELVRLYESIEKRRRK